MFLCIYSVVVVGCDETAVNSGRNAEPIQQLEELLHTTLQWLMCLLHANELPLRHLFLHLYALPQVAVKNLSTV